MKIMTKKLVSPKYPNLDIYFHMTNHYKKLRDVKSVVDTSLPKGGGACRGKCQIRSQSLTPTPKCNLENYGPGVNCKQYAGTLPPRSLSSPPRPPTRRSVYDMPEDIQVIARQAARSESQTKVPKSEKRPKNQNSANKPTVTKGGPQCCAVPKNEFDGINIKKQPVPAPRQNKLVVQQKMPEVVRSIQDHEYLQFSLRITEDIIRNDLYTNKEMKRVCKSHIEANRGRLDMQKMKEQVERLCKELNIPLDETDESASPSREDLKRTHQNLQSSLICICGPKHRAPKTENLGCVCNDPRCLPFQCVQHPPLNADVKVDLPQLMDVTSLECVTEVTEPSSSLATITSEIANNSALSFECSTECKEKCKKAVETPVPATSSTLKKESAKVSSHKPPIEPQEKPAPSQKPTTISDQKPSDATKRNGKMAENADDTKPKVTSFATPNQAPTESSPTKQITCPTNTSDEEYVLVSGPIYIPKILLQLSDESKEKTYSMLHSQADNVRHSTSYASTYPGDGSNVTEGKNAVVIDFDAFRMLPKVLQLRDLRDLARTVKPAASGLSSDGSVQINQTDYDETPQRDSDHPRYKDFFKPAETTISTDVVPTKQQTNIDTTVPATSTPRKSSGDSQRLYPNMQNKTIDSSPTKEAPKQDLLLGDDYKISPADEPYDSCLPYPLSLFYPSIATQTNNSDLTIAARLWSMPFTPKTIVEPKVARQIQPPVQEAPEPSTPKQKPTSSESSSESSVVVEPENDAMVSYFLSSKSSDKSEKGLGKRDDKKSVSSSDSPNTSAATQPCSSNFIFKEGENAESLSETNNTSSIQSEEDNKLEEDSTMKPPSVTTRNSDESGSFKALLDKLDKKHSVSPTDSQQVYVEQVLNDLDKYRRPEDQPPDKRQSLKHMATAIENTVLVSKVDLDTISPSEPKPAISLLHPSVTPITLPDQANSSEVLEPGWCGLRRKKKRKKEPHSPRASIDVKAFIGSPKKEIEVSETEDNNLESAIRRSIHFNNPKTPDIVYEEGAEPQLFVHRMGSISSDLSNLTQASKPSPSSN